MAVLRLLNEWQLREVAVLVPAAWMRQGMFRQHERSIAYTMLLQVNGRRTTV